MGRNPARTRVRRWIAGVTALALAVGVLVIPSVNVAAAEPDDMVLDWNANANAILGGPNPPPDASTPPGLGQGPPISTIHLAMVHGAIYDAVNSITRTHEPYLANLPPAPRSASLAAAVAQAAHDMLYGMTPASLPAVRARIDAMLVASLAEIADGPSENQGKAAGATAAAAMLAWRANDGRGGDPLWQTSTDVGKWRPVPNANLNVQAFVKDVVPFTLKSNDQFRTSGPWPLTSPQYAREFNEVKAKGAATGDTRTVDEDKLASFVSTNPMPIMNKGLRDIAAARGLSTAKQARLFAMTSMAAADALIGCWDDKGLWLAWRPTTAIREAANDGNPRTEADPNWLALYPIPGYPDQPSGYNCYAAGTMYAARLFFGTDRISFTLTSPGTAPLTNLTREYDRFTEVIDDSIEGRILTGFHFRKADVDGAHLGKQVARWVHKHYFERVH